MDFIKFIVQENNVGCMYRSVKGIPNVWNQSIPPIIIIYYNNKHSYYCERYEHRTSDSGVPTALTPKLFTY